MSVKVKLQEPITAWGKQIDEIDLLVPKGKHIRQCGMPFKVSDEVGRTRFDFDSAACAKYISVLGRIPESSVDSLGANDFIELQNRIVSFFGAGVPKTPSTDTSNSPPSSQAQETSSS